MDQSSEFTRFTVQTRVALRFAWEAALYYQQDHINTEHLLLGILCTPQSVAVRILRHMHIEEERAQQEVEALAQRGGAVTDKVSMAPQVKEAIKLAVQAANSLSDEFIGTEHLLLGLLSLDEGLAVTVLTSLGASLERAHELVSQEENRRIPHEAIGNFPISVAQQENAATDASSASSAREQPAAALDSERQQQASDYKHQVDSFGATYIICLGILLSLLYIFHGSVVRFVTSLEQASLLSILLHIQPVPDWFPGLILFFFLLILAFLTLVLFPLYWYLELVLPRRQGLVNMTFLNWLKARGKLLLIRVIPWLCFVELIFFLATIQPNIWWIWASLIAFLYMVIMIREGAMFIFSLFSPITPLPSGELHQQLTALLERLHISLRGIFVLEVSDETSRANAYFVGWGRGRRVLLTDTLLKQFTLDEIEIIVAHELGHLVHADLWKRVFFKALMVLGILFLLSRLLYSPASGWNIQFIEDNYLLLLSAACVLFLMLYYLYRAHLRHQERQADEFALQATGKVQAFKNAFTRLTNINMSVANASEHDGARDRTHPDLVQRLRHADEFAARQKAVTNAHPDSLEAASS